MHTSSFFNWIWQNRENRLLLLSSAIYTVIAFTWFKYIYPYPNFLPDSYSYLEAAFENLDINIWPIGYSKFLRFFSCLTNSGTALIFTQYCLLQTGILFLLFSLSYLLAPRKWTIRILFICTIPNPLLLHISNFISSDAVFTSLSLIWFTQILWILRSPTLKLLAYHSIVLLLAVMVRYNALYYPFVSIIIIALTSFNIRQKIPYIAFISATMLAFVIYTTNKYSKVTHTSQFSPFGGWQLASNALYAYSHIFPIANESVPDKFKSLHTIVNRHNDSLKNIINRPDAALGSYYLWDEKAPLKAYMRKVYEKDNLTTGLKQWTSMAPLYSSYGLYLIKSNPGAYIKHFLWPNIINYYVPQGEFLSIYNMGSDTIEIMAQGWFHYQTNKISSSTKDKHIVITGFFPYILAILNLVFLITFLGRLFLFGFKDHTPYVKKVLWSMMFVWLFNFIFSVLASPIVLRYQIFPLIITFSFLAIVIELFLQESWSKPIQEHHTHNPKLPVESKIQLS